MSTPARAWCLNHTLRDAQNECAPTKVGTVLKFNTLLHEGLHNASGNSIIENQTLSKLVFLLSIVLRERNYLNNSANPNGQEITQRIVSYSTTLCFSSV